jgi:hypothetical protein
VEGIFQNGSHLQKLTNLQEIFLPEIFILENKDDFCS